MCVFQNAGKCYYTWKVSTRDLECLWWTEKCVWKGAELSLEMYYGVLLKWKGMPMPGAKFHSAWRLCLAQGLSDRCPSYGHTNTDHRTNCPPLILFWKYFGLLKRVEWLKYDLEKLL